MMLFFIYIYSYWLPAYDLCYSGQAIISLKHPELQKVYQVLAALLAIWLIPINDSARDFVTTYLLQRPPWPSNVQMSQPNWIAAQNVLNKYVHGIIGIIAEKSLFHCYRPPDRSA